MATASLLGSVRKLLDEHRVGQMADEQLLERIAIDPDVMVGKPVVKGTRLAVEHILNLLAHGATAGEILEEYEGLVQEDIQSCLLFATRSLEAVSFLPLGLARSHHAILRDRHAMFATLLA